MSDSKGFDPPSPIERPICANCGWTMWIAHVEKHEPGYDRHTYKCQRCEFEETKVVKL